MDIDRSNKANGSGRCAVCTWRSAVLDADGDPCNLELRIDIASVDDSANGAKVAFDGTFFEKGGGICPAAPPRMQTMRSPPFIHGIIAADQSRHRCHRGRRSVPAVLRRQYQRHRRSFREASRITQPYTRDRGRSF